MEKARATPGPTGTLRGFVAHDCRESSPDTGVGTVGSAGCSAASDEVRDKEIAGVGGLGFPDCLGVVVKTAAMSEMRVANWPLGSSEGKNCGNMLPDSREKLHDRSSTNPCSRRDSKNGYAFVVGFWFEEICVRYLFGVDIDTVLAENGRKGSLHKLGFGHDVVAVRDLATSCEVEGDGQFQESCNTSTTGRLLSFFMLLGRPKLRPS